MSTKYLANWVVNSKGDWESRQPAYINCQFVSSPSLASLVINNEN